MQVNIVSWNTFGASIEKLNQCHSDILYSDMPNAIFIQEAGSFKNYDQEVEIVLGKEKYRGYFVKDEKAKYNFRCTTGILLQKRHFEGWKFGKIDSGEKRPIVAAYNETSDSLIATVHAIAANKPARSELSGIIENFKSIFSKWFLMGDFNCHPEDLIADGVIGKENISYSEEFTHNSGTTIDFAVFSDNYVGTNVEIASKSEFVPLESDHYPIRAIIDI